MFFIMDFKGLKKNAVFKVFSRINIGILFLRQYCCSLKISPVLFVLKNVYLSSKKENRLPRFRLYRGAFVGTGAQ